MNSAARWAYNESEGIKAQIYLGASFAASPTIQWYLSCFLQTCEYFIERINQYVHGNSFYSV